MKLYKILATYLLATVMMAQAFMVPIVYISFKLQQDYISKNLCEYRDTPITTCYGSCVLKKELKKTAEEQKETTSNQQSKVEIIFCQALSSLMPAPHRPLTEQPFFEDFTHLISTNYKADFFIPPRG